MVTTEIKDGVLALKLSALHKLLALKGSLQIPLDAIESVAHDPESARRGPEGTRNLGTNIPYLVSAGTFNAGVERTFWDVHDPANAITIKLKRAMFGISEDAFSKVIVEVADPAKTIQQIEQALPK